MRDLAPAGALAAALALSGCAGGNAASRAELDALRAEVRALRADRDDLARRLDRVELLSAKLAARAGPPAAAPAAAAPPPAPGAAPAPVVPPDLEVVRVEPRAREPRGPRAPPPLATAVPIADPDPARLEALERPTGRDLSTEADAELRAARRRTGLARAHALEDFAARFPRHPQADNALAEAAGAYADAGLDGPACALARRVPAEYPAGDAMSEALERLAWCESRRGDVGDERKLLERLVAEYPRSPAAERASERLAAITGHAGDPAPATGPARSGP